MPTARSAKTTLKPEDNVVEFATWDQLVAEAQVDVPPYQLPVSAKEKLTIPVPSGTSYALLQQALRTGDIAATINNLAGGDEKLQKRLWELMGKAHFPIVDLLATKVLRHYFGQNGVVEEAEPGESSAS
jgi:hypothetical protein